MARDAWPGGAVVKALDLRLRSHGFIALSGYLNVRSHRTVPHPVTGCGTVRCHVAPRCRTL